MAVIRGTSGPNWLEDNAGNDTLLGLAGDDYIFMAAGGTDTTDGGAGRDVLSYVNYALALQIDVAAGTARDSKGTADTFKKFEDFQGGFGNDRIDLGEGGLSASGNSGNDTLIGGRSDNWFNGGRGNDKIDGGAGRDMVQYLHDGSPEAEIFQGIVVNLAAGTAIDGWGDKDTLVSIESIEGTDFEDKITGNAFSNVLIGHEGDDVIHGGDSVATMNDDDTLIGGAGNDTLTLVHGIAMGNEGNDRIKGLRERKNNPDKDWAGADYSDAESGIVANLTSKALGDLAAGNKSYGFNVADGLGGIDKLSNLKFIRDGAHDDIFHVDATWTNSYGKWIEIVLTRGDDHVSFSGLTAARVSYAAAEGGVRADLQRGTAEDMRSKHNFIGDDTFSGHNEFRGSRFNDEILGRQNSDKRLRGNSGDDEIDGRKGNDLIEGDAGNDELIGGAGKDKLIGGAGQDDLYGGMGADRFIFNTIDDSTPSARGRDKIYDFSRKQKDKVDLKAIDAKSGSNKNDAFDFIGKAKQFTGDKGDLRYEQKYGSTYVYGDVDGDRKADFAIQFTGTHDLKASDFLL